MNSGTLANVNYCSKTVDGRITFIPSGSVRGYTWQTRYYIIYMRAWTKTERKRPGNIRAALYTSSFARFLAKQVKSSISAFLDVHHTLTTRPFTFVSIRTAVITIAQGTSCTQFDIVVLRRRDISLVISELNIKELAWELVDHRLEEFMATTRRVWNIDVWIGV